MVRLLFEQNMQWIADTMQPASTSESTWIIVQYYLLHHYKVLIGSKFHKILHIYSKLLTSSLWKLYNVLFIYSILHDVSTKTYKQTSQVVVLTDIYNWQMICTDCCSRFSSFLYFKCIYIQAAQKLSIIIVEKKFLRQVNK